LGLGKAVTFFGKAPKKAAIFPKPITAAFDYRGMTDFNG
jgi:hypothetical protein